jgi:general secretion pathway protein N
VINRWSWLALGTGAYLAFALSAFPAQTAVSWFAPSEVALAGVGGTLWSGSAASGTIGGLAVRDLRWRLRPWQLLIGRLGASIEAQLADGFIATNVAASATGVRFSDLRGGSSLAALAGVLPVRGMTGQASVELSALELENGWPSRVVGQLRLRDLQVAPFVATRAQQRLALGDYTVTFTDAAPREIAGRFVDNGGPLEVSGTVVLDAKRAYTLDALIEPRADAPEEIVSGLAIMTSEPDAEGRRRLTLTGSL